MTRREGSLNGVRSALVLSLLLSWAATQSGCGARSERRAAPSEAGAPSAAGAGGVFAVGGAGGATDVFSADGVLVIPVDPRRASSLSVLLQESPAGLVAEGPRELSLALGPEYPNAVTFDLAQSYIFRESSSFYDATSGLQLTNVVAAAGIDARRVDAQHFEVGVRAEGDFAITLTGRWTPSEAEQPVAAAFSIDVLARVRRVARVEWISCSASPVYLVSGTVFRTGYPRLQDSDGIAFSPSNARGARGATLSIHASPGTQLSTTDGIGALVAVGDEQTVSVRHANVEVGSFHLVPQGRVDGLHARFLLTAPALRGFTELNSGDTVLLWPASIGSTLIQAVPAVSIAGTAVCSQIVPDWFSIRAQAPEVCPLASELGCERCVDDALPERVSVQAIGACRLAVDAPELNAGNGLSAELDVQVVSRD